MIALVTGANRGIGQEVCRQLAEAGHQVILTSRNEEKGKKAVAELGSDQISYHPLDVTNDASIAKIRSYVEEQYGRLDMLINNAGIHYDSWQNAEQADLKIAQEAFDANLLGPWRVSQAFIPMMREHSYGRIVNVSSGAGALNGMSGGTPAYSISKASLNVLTIKLAADLKGTGILVNSVGPGWVRTDMGGKEAPRSVAEGAEGIVWAATLPKDGPTGGFFRDGKRIEW
ncbi:SDR family oxidoreductase [Tunicatimonas pelagia]|uniref:SDR family oxidoreductase n=1 Tax=Tunicatimonas pelagia TaxID=931531 RepID=UPI0026671F8C|nr:SDR family oxidoreductase [Tunicatimonas pelagia]WKN44677.1 SDR family oxidoreductase [Tunicatimonas pelagia]